VVERLDRVLNALCAEREHAILPQSNHFTSLHSSTHSRINCRNLKLIPSIAADGEHIMFLRRHHIVCRTIFGTSLGHTNLNSRYINTTGTVFLTQRANSTRVGIFEIFAPVGIMVHTHSPYEISFT
jgi:hypothetical protein